MSDKEYPSRVADKFVVRFTNAEEMREKLRVLAEKNRRSMNSEVMEALANHLNITEQIAAEERDKAIKEMADDLGIMHTTAAQAYDKGYRKIES